MQKGYSLIHTITSGNVLGVVIAPKGTEHYPKDRRMFVWRAIIQPLVVEVAESNDPPLADMDIVLKALCEYCVREGLSLPLRQEREPCND